MLGGGAKVMNVSLTRELEDIVREKVESGMYGSSSAVLREALRLLHQRDQEQEARMDQLRREVAVGTRELDAGKSHPFDAEAMKRRVRRHLQSAAARNKRG